MLRNSLLAFIPLPLWLVYLVAHFQGPEAIGVSYNQLAALYLVQFASLHSLPFAMVALFGIAEWGRRQTWKPWQIKTAQSLVVAGLIALYGAILSGYEGFGALYFAIDTGATYAGFVLATPSNRNLRMLCVRWAVCFAWFLLALIPGGILAELLNAPRAEYLIGFSYFFGLTLLEGAGVYQRINRRL